MGANLADPQDNFYMGLLSLHRWVYTRPYCHKSGPASQTFLGNRWAEQLWEKSGAPTSWATQRGNFPVLSYRPAQFFAQDLKFWHVIWNALTQGSETALFYVSLFCKVMADWGHAQNFGRSNSAKKTKIKNPALGLSVNTPKITVHHIFCCNALNTL